MDNIKDENLRRLGKYIADSLMESAKQTSGDDWIEENISNKQRINIAWGVNYR